MKGSQMVHVKTSCGFEMDVDPDMFNDMELFDAVADADSGDENRIVSGLSTVVSKILGSKKKELFDLLRNENGRVPLDSIKSQIKEIMALAAPKNT